MEISNKTLAWLVVAAIVVSIFGTTMSVMNLSGRQTTGYATSNTTGEAKVDVSQAVVLRFEAGLNSTDFGVGSIDTANNQHSCNMAINTSTSTAIVKTAGCLNFNTNAAGLVLENVGTSNLNVTLNFSKNDTDFLQTNPDTGNGSRWFKYTVWNGTGGGCRSPNATMWGVWYDVGVPNTTVNVCGNLTWTNGNKLLIGLNISVNENLTTTAKTVIIRAQGTSI